MSVQNRAVSVKVAQHVLWHFGDRNLGIEGGHFVSRLLVLASAADQENLEKLGQEWPEYVIAFRAVTSQQWGLDWLRAIVKAELDGEEFGLDFMAVRS